MSRSKTLPKFSLNSFISPAQTEDWYKNVGYQDAKNIIKEKMKSSVENFIAIGYHLKHIDETEQYKEDGYANIWECAKQEFGFSQARASRCINICKAYSVNGDSPYIDERFKNFNPSQLQEMLPFKDDERLIGQITPDMSSREIRREIRDAKKEYTGEGIESSSLPGQMQIKTIEGEYREFVPVSDSDEDNENPAEETKDPPDISAPARDSGKEELRPAGQNYDLERIKVMLPGEVGETVYFCDGDNIEEGIIDQIILGEEMKPRFRVYDTEGGVWFHFEVTDFGRILFYTHEEAEKVNDKREEKKIL
ncbi:MAG: hypothetical protein K2I96_24190 [Lachnospiraceae bacterium]|nr:hypothetical protein [Lachnospiraceae bacterium]